jgi:hypothetical protein
MITYILPVFTPFTTTIDIQISYTKNPTSKSKRNGVLEVSSWEPRLKVISWIPFRTFLRLRL